MAFFHPDTPANRKLFRAISAINPARVRKALEEGASVTALGGYDKVAEYTPLSHAIWRLKKGGQEAAEVVRLLLQAGARMDEKPPRDIVPMVQAVAHPRAKDSLRALVDHAGGVDAFVEGFTEETAREMISRVAIKGLEDPLTAEVFFRTWERHPQSAIARSSVPGVHWLWEKVGMESKISPAVRQMIEDRVPCPTPQSLGHRKWLVWMGRLNDDRSGIMPALLKEGLKATPIQWWNTLPHPEEGEAPMPANRSLMRLVLNNPRSQSIEILTDLVKRLPGGWDDPHAPDPHELVRASAVSVGALKKTLRRVPPGDYRLTLSAALRDNLKSHSFSGSLNNRLARVHNNRLARALNNRLARVHALLEAGADPSIPDEEGNTALHLASSLVCSYARRQWPRTLNAMLDAGACWNTVNKEGETPLEVLRRSCPIVASEMIAKEMETRLPSPAPSRPAMRL